MTSGLHTRLDDCIFCALDLETTGVNPLTHRIVEVGMVRFTLRETIVSFERLVNPGMPIPPEVILIHGITDDMVAGAPSIGQIHRDILEFMAGSYLVIHNPYFDLAFIDRVVREEGGDTSLLEAFDTVRLSRKAFPYMDNHRLSTLAEHFSIPGSSHRALYDATCCMEVFRRALASDTHSPMRTFGELLQYHGKLVRPRPGKVAVTRQGRDDGLTIGRLARIRYQDSSGRVTVREIVPIEIIKQGRKSYLRAHCRLRGEIRFFNRDGILEIL